MSYEYNEDGNKFLEWYDIRFSDENSMVSRINCETKFLNFDKEGNRILAEQLCKEDGQTPNGDYTIQRVIGNYN